MQRKLLGLLFSAAVYGFYKYSKMTLEEKQDLRKKGSDLLKRFTGVTSPVADKKMAAVSTENNY